MSRSRQIVWLAVVVAAAMLGPIQADAQENGGTLTNDGGIGYWGSDGSDSGWTGPRTDPCTYIVMQTPADWIRYPNVPLPPDAPEDSGRYEYPWVVANCGAPINATLLYQLGNPPPIAALQASALAQLSVPLPEAQTAPPADQFQVVGITSRMWIDAARTTAPPVTVSVPGATVSVLARFDGLAFDMGVADGIVRCDGAGAPFVPHTDPSASDCSFVYTDDSGDGTFTVLAATEWEISWTCLYDSNGDAAPDTNCPGAPGPLGFVSVVSEPVDLEVLQLQAVGTS